MQRPDPGRCICLVLFLLIGTGYLPNNLENEF